MVAPVNKHSVEFNALTYRAVKMLSRSVPADKAEAELTAAWESFGYRRAEAANLALAVMARAVEGS